MSPKRRAPLSTLAQLAEIIASVAVLITLVFLVVGVRQNTEFPPSPEERKQLKVWMWSLVLGGNSVFSLVLLASLIGIVTLPITGAFFAALIWQLVLSAVLFGRLILQG